MAQNGFSLPSSSENLQPGPQLGLPHGPFSAMVTSGEELVSSACWNQAAAEQLEEGGRPKGSLQPVLTILLGYDSKIWDSERGI